ncbi:MAG TPA: alkaline phosphatase family protein, partial [Methanothrix sp.]|nr:alkaline phosphatase family protein [Methanothrix sp.]
LLQRGDAMPVLQEMDAVLYLDDNSLHGAEPIPGFRAGAAASLSPILQKWRDRFGRYTGEPGTPAYINYNAWALDAAADLVGNLSGRKFIMLVNAGGTDSAGHELGAEGYRETVAALDEPLGKLAETCRKKHVLLVVTADHGMVFPNREGKGGHSAEKYADRLEARRVPLVFLGPGVEELNLGGSWSETDIAPTLLSLLNISAGLTGNGKEMPVAESFRLAVSGAPEDLTLWQGEERLAEGSAGQCIFWGLSRGAYALRAGEKEWPVTVNGDVAVDLGRPGLGEGWKRIVGVVLILIINLVGAFALVRIWRKGD